MNGPKNHMQYMTFAALISTVYSPAAHFTLTNVPKRIKYKKKRTRSTIQNRAKTAPTYNYDKKDMRA